MARLSLMCGALALTVACAADPPADIVVYGTTWTGDADRPWAGAVAIRGETIVTVGDCAAIAPLVGSRTEVVAASGMVLPGLMDDHAHFMSGGFQLASVDLRNADAPAEFARRIGAFARTLQPGE